MESHCLLCNHSGFEPLRRYRPNSKPGKRIFRDMWIGKCNNCKFVQVYPRPDNDVISNYYISNYRSGTCYGADVADENEFPKDNLFYFNRGESVADLIKPYLHKKSLSILDIGCGFGHILYSLGNYFPESERFAIEFSDKCVRHLKSLGVKVFNEPVMEVLNKHNLQFNTVVISHVLEHLLNPRETLETVHSKLEPGGLLYVEVPNIPPESLLSYFDHVWAPRFDEPHITFFSEALLLSLLEKVNFKVLFCSTAGPQYRKISKFHYSLPNFRWLVQDLIPRRIFHWLRRQNFTKPIRVRDRDDSFFSYGGQRIWIRCIGQKQK